MWPCLFIKIQVRLQNNATLTVVHCIHVHSNVQIQIRSQNMTLLDAKIILHNLCWYPFLLFLLFHLLFCLRLSSSSFLPNKLIAELISNNDYCIIQTITTWCTTAALARHSELLYCLLMGTMVAVILEKLLCLFPLFIFLSPKNLDDYMEKFGILSKICIVQIYVYL